MNSDDSYHDSKENIVNNQQFGHHNHSTSLDDPQNIQVFVPSSVRSKISQIERNCNKNKYDELYDKFIKENDNQSIVDIDRKSPPTIEAVHQDEQLSNIFIIFISVLDLLHLMIPLLIATSQVLDRKHHVSDVLIGALLAILIVGPIRLVYHRIIDNRLPLLLSSY